MDNHQNTLLHSIRSIKSQAGFSLIEILVAMAIFLIVSAGVTSMMIVGVRSTAGARLTTMGKAVAQQQMEDIRGRTFYVPYSNDPDVGTTADVDILDRYFPDTYTDHMTDPWGWESWYTAGGGDAYYTVVSPADNNGVTLTVETRFVDNGGNTIVPTSSYNTEASGSDNPPSDLISVKVTATWLSRGTEETYSIDSIISRADSASQGGSADGGGDSGCSMSSLNSIDVTAGTLTIYTGTVEPYTVLVDGSLGKANGTSRYDCNSSQSAFGTGGQLAITNGLTHTGATINVLGPPNDSDSSGPLTVGPTTTWPKIYLGNSRADVNVQSSDDTGTLSMAADAELSGSNVQLSQISEALSGTIANYKRWDFINPSIATTTTSGVKAADADIVQNNGVSTATGVVKYGQINFLPVQRYTTNAASALQGLIIVRDFQATVISEASEADGSASNSVNYSATIGMFNTTKATTCTGDACYDFYSISQSNPIQTAINLNSASYKPQKALLTEWYSYTAADISNASYAAADGSTAMVSIDALLKISAKYATEVREKTNGTKQLEIISQQGLQKLWLGTFETSVQQNA